MSRRLTAVLQRLILAAILLALLVMMGPLGAVPHASAAGDWYVNPGESIQTAIDAAYAAGGGTVHVAAGTYYERITLKNLVSVMGAGATITTLNGETDGHAIEGSWAVSSLDLDSTAMLDGFTVMGGDCGMYNDNSCPAVANCIFTENGVEAGLSRGMYNSGSSPIVTNCTFSGNGASYCPGGGMYNSGSSPIVTDCMFSGNYAFLFGSGMWNASGSSPRITNCTFSGNEAKLGGAGMWNSDSSPEITNCIFSGDYIAYAGNGGGIGNSNSSPIVADCIFSGNYAEGYGGGMCNSSGSSPIVTNCTFSGNRAYVGAGMWNSGSSPIVTNCVLWGDYYDYEMDEIRNEASSPVVTYCDVAGGYPGVGNIDQDPLLAADFHLQEGSPCIDAGDNSAPQLPSTDFDGQLRICDGDHDGNAVVDMGVDEVPGGFRPPVPLLLAPADGQYIGYGTPTLDWTDVDAPPGVTYDVQIDNDDDFSSVVVGDVGLTSSAYTLAAGESLSDGLYYWRARAVNGTGLESAWTAPWSFTVDTVAPAVPILLSPINGAHTTDSTPALDWSDVSDASPVHYRLQVDDNADFSSSEVYQAWLDGSGYTVFSALADGVHYWRARSVDGAGNVSAWTGSWSFTVGAAALPAPHLFYPPNGACIRDCTPYLDWSYITDPSGVHYQLQVDNNADFSSPVINSTWVGISAYTVPTALWNGTFYWRVRAVNGMGDVSDWTTARRFSVDTKAPSTPYLLYPGRWAVTSDHTPYLDWTWVSDPSGVHYQLQVAGNASFYSPKINRTWLPCSSYTVITWLPRGIYYWRVRVVDGAGNASAWTTARPFVVR